MTLKKKRLTKSELILDAWEDIGSDSAGAFELELLRKNLELELGPGVAESPASVARTLADAGIPLRHPEVLEADTRWREGRMNELFAPGEISFDTLDSAFDSMTKLEGLRRQFAQEGDDVGCKRLLNHGREQKKALQQTTGPGSILAREVVQWLSVWLQTPNLLEDWLALRRKSADFARKFEA